MKGCLYLTRAGINGDSEKGCEQVWRATCWIKKERGYVEKEKRDISSSLTCLQPGELEKTVLK